MTIDLDSIWLIAGPQMADNRNRICSL